jgi:hypothetical protein
LYEQRHRLDAAQSLYIRQVSVVRGRRQGRNREETLRLQIKRTAAGHQHRKVGAGTDEIADGVGTAHEVFEIVEDEQ